MNARGLLLFLPLLASCATSGGNLGKVPKGTSAIAYTNEPIDRVATCIAGVENAAAEPDGTRYVIRPAEGIRTYYVGPNDGDVYTTHVAVEGPLETGERGEQIGQCAAAGVVRSTRE